MSELKFNPQAASEQIAEVTHKSQFADIFQDPDWLAVSAGKGWVKSQNLVLENQESEDVLAGAQVYQLSSKIFGNYLYLQHGPLISDDSFDNADKRASAENWGKWDLDADSSEIYLEFYRQLLEYARSTGNFAVVVEPILDIKSTIWKRFSSEFKFKRQSRSILPSLPMFIDLERPAEEILAKLDKKTRYNVRYAQKNGVTIEHVYPSDDSSLKQKTLDKYLGIQQSVAQGKGYTIPPRAFFEAAWDSYADRKNVSFGFAHYQGKVISVNFSQYFKDWAGSYYTANSKAHPKLRASYLLKWDTILEAQRNGAKVFDMWGKVPGARPGHPQYGYGKFKQGFNPVAHEFAGRLVFPISQLKTSAWLTLGDLSFYLSYLR